MMSSPTTTHGSGTSDDSELMSLLSEFFRHLSSGDAHAAASLWDVPALILGDEQVHGPLSRDRLAEMLAAAPGAALESPARRGDVALEPSIERIERPSSRVAVIDARWPRPPRAGLLHGIDAATFLVRSDELGQPKIRGLVLHSARTDLAGRGKGATRGAPARP